MRSLYTQKYSTVNTVYQTVFAFVIGNNLIEIAITIKLLPITNTITYSRVCATLKSKTPEL